MKHKIYQTQKQQLRRLTKCQFAVLLRLCRLSKNLYNVAIYLIRQHFFTEKKFLRYESNYHACKDNENYQSLNTDIAQQTMKVADRSFRSFFNLIKKAQKGGYQFSHICLPKYLPKDGYFSLIIPRIKVKDGKWKLPMSRDFKKSYGEIEMAFPSNLDPQTIKEVRIHPRYDGRFFEAEYVYEVECEPISIDEAKAMAIDIGLDNLATCITTDGASFIIDGKHLKSINHQYNKRIAYLSSIRQRQGIESYTRLQCRLTIRRNNQIRDSINKAARCIINHCTLNRIGILVIGYNPDWKRSLNIGKKNNQNFVQIPHASLRFKLKYLCTRYGIQYIEQEESYTSKASFLDSDLIPVWSGESLEYPFSGRRVCRGIYQTSNGTRINADCNGAANILRKSKQKVNLDQLYTGALASPLRKRLR
jgi:putative transposase